MKSLAQLLNKKYDKKLKDNKDYKPRLAEMQNFLRAQGLLHKENEDQDCIRYELLVSSLKQKQQFEDVFFDTYVKMFDYWYDLTYQERKKQMNVDIDRLKESLRCFSYEGEQIFMPCFDQRFNHLYHTEIVLLDLKQYHSFIREFQKELDDKRYGALPYVYGFTSCEVMAMMEDSFVLYHPISKRLYVYEHMVYQRCLSFDPNSDAMDAAELKEAAMLLLLDREIDLAQSLLSGSLVNDKMKKKITKLVNKKEKRTKNNE